MIVDERTYHIRPGHLDEFVRTYEEAGLQPQLRIIGNLLGYYTTDIGELNCVVHLWGYASMEERTRLRKLLYSDPDWKAYLLLNTKHIVKMENRILIPTSFSPIGRTN